MKKHPKNEFENPRNVPAFGAMPPKGKIEAAGHEMKEREPKILKHTEKKFGKKRAEKQRIAVMLSKARRG